MNDRPLPLRDGESRQGLTNAELRMLLSECLQLWSVEGRINPGDAGVEIVTGGATFVLQPAPPDMRPVRWLLHRPDRNPRAAPSIGAALTALRNALGAEGGNKLKIGAAP